MHAYIHAWPRMFLFYTAFYYFGLFNLLTGMFVDKAQQRNTHNKQHTYHNHNHNHNHTTTTTTTSNNNNEKYKHTSVVQQTIIIYQPYNTHIRFVDKAPSSDTRNNVFIHHQHHHPEGVVYRSLCPNSSTLVASEILQHVSGPGYLTSADAEDTVPSDGQSTS